jgi:hypothetical protein
MSKMSSLMPEKILAEQLRYVGRTVPHFRGLNCDDGRPLEDFPLTFKPAVRNNYASFISDDFCDIRQKLVDFLNSELIHTLPSGGWVEELHFGSDVVVGRTTGTSGTILCCPKTMADRLRLGVGIWRQRRAIDPLVCPSKLFRFIHTGTEVQFCDPWNCDLGNLQHIYDDIRDGGYRWLHSPAPLLTRHVAVFQREGWRPVLPDLKFIEFTGYFLHRQTASELCEFFNVLPVDQYAMNETWAVATTCSHGLLHLNEHNVHVEIIDDSDRSVDPGHIGRIVVTSLQERLLPFVRYVTDDYGRYIEKNCDCLLGRKTLALVEGRSGNLIHGAPGRVFGDDFFMVALKHIQCFDLLCIRIRQTGPSDFTVQTNAIAKPAEFIAALRKGTETLVGQQLTFQHTVFTEPELRIQERLKPWLFRCEVRSQTG